MMRAKATYWVHRYDAALREVTRPVLPPLPPFQKKHPDITTLPDYSVSEYPEEWWALWPYRELPSAAHSILDCDAFESRCLAAGVDQFLVDKVVTRLRHGARLGAKGQGRTAARGENLKNFFTLGERSIDTLVSWLRTDPPFMAGPFLPTDLRGGDFRANPLQSTLKPNNCAR